MSELKKIADATYLMEKVGSMRVPGLIIATEELLNQCDIEQPLEQVRNVATLPGIVGHSIAMPDIHWGYGFPIGGVAATDARSGVISPGGVGYDINCGVRLAVVPRAFKEIDSKKRAALIQSIYRNVPSGVGNSRKEGKSLTDADYRALFENGARWSIEQGFGFENDLEHMESHGVIEGASYDAISNQAKERGAKQLGSIGSGNHFVEVGEVQQLFLPDTAKQWGIEKGHMYILIHSGSRGFGHQVCQDALNVFIKKGFDQGLPDRQLVAAPINSPEGQEYFAAMAAAANFAFNNRQQILHYVRVSLNESLGIPGSEVHLVYDVCHNIAKFEEYDNQKVCVHRKGATRAFGPGHKELAPIFQSTGQPVIVPGDMGRASYLLAGLGNALTFSSCCHGAGRARSRVKSRKEWHGRDPIAYMKSQGVKVMATSNRTIVEEMPDAYKDVDLVVEAVEEAKLATRVAKLKPHMVLKG
ncbi:MAG: RtcB family protein [Waddliaceae bacterium]